MDLLDNNEAYSKLKSSIDNHYTKSDEIAKKSDLQDHRTEVENTKRVATSLQGLVDQARQDIDFLKKEAADNRKNDDFTQKLSEDNRRHMDGYRRIFDEHHQSIQQSKQLVENNAQIVNSVKQKSESILAHNNELVKQNNELRQKVDEHVKAFDEHKQITYDRIDKLAKLFLSINK
jgi:hypothetical protein